MRYLFVLLVIGGLGAGGYAWYTHSVTEHGVEYRTAAVKRGNLVSSIGATGTVEPEEVIDIGAQVQGMIKQLGVDPRAPNKHIDYGSQVDADTILAHIDDSVYKAQVNSARANLQRSEADQQSNQAKLRQFERDWQRAQTLLPTKSIAESDFDTARANFETAKATVGVGQATIDQNKAALDLAETNLNYTTIKSPVKGIIVDRRVNVGQTVVAALNAPSLFLLAKDLKRLQVWASVNEADIGRISVGQPVEFSVDAFPGQAFVGTVLQIRLNATMTQNVVTYTVVVTTDNSSGKLLPYLTANLHFEIERRTGVLMVPSVALKWQPSSPQAIAPDVRDKITAKKSRKEKEAGATPAAGATAATAAKPGQAEVGAGRPASAKGDAAKNPSARKKEQSLPAQTAERETRGRVWVVDGEYVRPLDVKVGLTDGNNTEIIGPDVQEGLEVVTGEIRREASDASGTSNPFAPKIFSGRSKT